MIELARLTHRGVEGTDRTSLARQYEKRFLASSGGTGMNSRELDAAKEERARCSEINQTGSGCLICASEDASATCGTIAVRAAKSY